MHYPAVLTEAETVTRLLAGASIGRYGDGELKLCLERSACAQEHNPAISFRLREILKSESDNFIVGIPRISDRSMMNAQKKSFWSQYTATKYTSLYKLDKVYGSAFITRPDSVPGINTHEYFNCIKALWDKRHVILINGNGKRFDKDPSILDNAESVECWDYPAQNAWEHYAEIMERAGQQRKDKIFILALGPTATVLTFDIHNLGFQALDLGHLGMFYARLNRGKQ